MKKKKTKKEGAKKEKGRRKVSAYMLYSRHMRPSVAKDNPGIVMLSKSIAQQTFSPHFLSRIFLNLPVAWAMYFCCSINTTLVISVAFYSLRYRCFRSKILMLNQMIGCLIADSYSRV